MSDTASADHMTVTAPSELAFPSADEFARQLTDLAPVGDLVVDLHDVHFMDSCGLRTLISEGARRNRAGGTLAVRNPNRVVRRLFELTGVHKAITILD